MPECEDFLEGVTWFSIELGNNPDQAVASKEFFTGTYAEAKAVRNRWEAAYPFWWISELGEYQSGRVRKVDWMYFAWAPNVSWGESYGRGTGIPYKSKTFVQREYVPCGPEKI